MKKLEKLVFHLIEDTLQDTILIPDGNSLWITDSDIKSWYFEYRNDGSFLYNSIFFHSKMRIFTLKNNELSFLLRSWFEKSFPIHVRQTIRTNSDLDWKLEKIRKGRREWDMKNRYGFNYDIIKRYLDLKKQAIGENVTVKNYITL